jgi:uncharacterized protein (UPF0216 family)
MVSVETIVELRILSIVLMTVVKMELAILPLENVVVIKDSVEKIVVKRKKTFVKQIVTVITKENVYFHKDVCVIQEQRVKDVRQEQINVIAQPIKLLNGLSVIDSEWYGANVTIDFILQLSFIKIIFVS